VVEREDGLGGELHVRLEADRLAVGGETGAIARREEPAGEREVAGRALASATSASVGWTVTSPRRPSTMMMSPVRIVASASAAPTTAGISSARAMIDVWLVRVPISVTNATAGSFTMPAVSAGDRSCATTIIGCSSLGIAV
jgi:hypothetical protein